MRTAPAVEAILFDVFGTVVDWRSGVIRAGERVGREQGRDADWGLVADSWRRRYHPSMEPIRRGEAPWTNLDHLHRRSLDQVIDDLGLSWLGDKDRELLVRAWHELDPWPDAIPGLRRLAGRHVLAPLSNGHVALLTRMAKRAGLPWDVILSAELARRYKPDPEVYLTAVHLLDLAPDRAMMVAAHGHDLHAARSVGLRTAFIERPREWGPDSAASYAPPDTAPFDVSATDIEDLARQLDA